MAIEFNGKFGNVNNALVSGKKAVDAEGKKDLAAQKNVFEEANKADNKYQGEKTDLLDAKAYYNSLGVSLGNVKRNDLNAQITNIVGPSVMKRVAAASPKTVEEISTSANNAYDNILADDTQALFAMAGLKHSVNAPSLEKMQTTLEESPFINALFA